MIKEPSSPKLSSQVPEGDDGLIVIKSALQAKTALLETLVGKSIKGAKPWKLHAADYRIPETEDVIDLVFEQGDDKDRRFVLVNIVVPSLKIGKKTGLDGKIKLFQTAQGISITKLRKAILLIRKPGEPAPPPPKPGNTPILDLQWKIIFPPTPKGTPVPPLPAKSISAPAFPETCPPVVASFSAPPLPATPSLISPVESKPSAPPSPSSASTAAPVPVQPLLPTPDPTPAQPSSPSQAQLASQAPATSQPQGPSQTGVSQRPPASPSPKPSPANPPAVQAVQAVQAVPAIPAVPAVPATPAVPTISPTFSREILESLRAAIVQECLATMHKRRNKYIRKGLWRWIEREITDRNIHFFLIIISCIYQGEVSEILSRKFKELDDYCKNPDPVLDAVFSREAALASEIVKGEDRHRKALRRFLECFSQTPPFEYLRSIFLKEFRTSRDSVRSRISVFQTLKELMVRCGFSGEKEVLYPLEILDELGIFQGIFLGDYTELRIENAVKKLRQLVPQVDWKAPEVYRLRDETARLFQILPTEFNLNAFLPQAFVKLNVPERSKVAPQQGNRAQPQGRSADGQRSQNPQHAGRHPAPPPPLPPQGERSPASEGMENTAAPGLAEPRPAPRSQPSSGQPPRHHDQRRPQAAPPPAPAATTPPVAATGGTASSAERNPPSTGLLSRPNSAPAPKRYEPDLDESRHRHFESFGGHPLADEEALLIALELDRAGNAAAAETPEVTPTHPSRNQDNSAWEEPPRKRPADRSGNGNGVPLASLAGTVREIQEKKRNNNKRRFGKRRHKGPPRSPSGMPA